MSSFPPALPHGPITEVFPDVFTVTGGGRLIWTGTTRSVDLTSIEATTDQISRVLVPELAHAGVLAPG